MGVYRPVTALPIGLPTAPVRYGYGYGYGYYGYGYGKKYDKYGYGHHSGRKQQ